MKKVNIHIIKKWVSDELARLLNGEDDVVTELVFNIIEENRFVSARDQQCSVDRLADGGTAKYQRATGAVEWFSRQGCGNLLS